MTGGEGNFEEGDDDRLRPLEDGTRVGESCSTGVVAFNSLSAGKREALSK